MYAPLGAPFGVRGTLLPCARVSRPNLRVFIVRIASRIQVHNDHVEITLDPVELLMLLGGSQGNPATADLEGMAPRLLDLRCSTSPMKTGR